MRGAHPGVVCSHRTAGNCTCTAHCSQIKVISSLGWASDKAQPYQEREKWQQEPKAQGQYDELHLGDIVEASIYIRNGIATVSNYFTVNFTFDTKLQLTKHTLPRF